MKKPLLLALVAAVCVGTAILVYLWAVTPSTSQGYFQSGERHFKQARYPEAIIQFLNSLEKDPRNRDARYLLAASYMHQQQWSSAVRELRTLLENYPDDIEAKLRLGNLYLAGALGDKKLFNLAREIADSILAKSPSSVEALVLSGNAAAGLLDLSSSVESLERALRLDPDNIPDYIMLGTYQAQRKKLPEAEQAFLTARKLDPKNKSALISLANYHRAVGNKEAAEQVFNEALAIYPSDRDIYLPIVLFYFQEGKIDIAERILRTAQDKLPQDPGPTLVLVDLYLRQNRTADVRKLLTDLKERLPDNLPVSKKIALIYVKTDPEWARREVDRVLKVQPNDPEGHILMGELQFFSGDLDAAEATFKKDIFRDSRYPEPLFFLGSIAAKKGQTDVAQTSYVAALELNPRYIPPRVSLAEIYFNRGRLPDAREEVRKLLDLDPGLFAARLLRAAIDTREKNFAPAEAELFALLKEHPENPLVHRSLGRYYQERGMPQAEQHFLKASELQPDGPEYLNELVRLYVNQKRPEKAIESINRIPDSQKKSFHYQLMGNVFSSTGKYAEAEGNYRKAIELDPKGISAYLQLSEDYIKSGKLNEAMSALDALEKITVNYAPAHARRAQVYKLQGKVDDAAKSYKRALELDPNLSFAANNYAYLLAEQKQDLDLALTWARTARKLEPENPNYADTLGWIYYERKEYLLALDQLRFAADKRPDNPTTRYHLAMTYWRRNQIAEAKSALQQALSSNTEFKERNLATSALREIMSQPKQND